jgi:hypothetical protein
VSTTLPSKELPTATHHRAETHETPSNVELRVPAGPFTGAALHFFPFQLSASGSEPTDPTVMQFFAEVQDTADRTAGRGFDLRGSRDAAVTTVRW